MTTKKALYEQIQAQTASLTEGESDVIANMANIAAVLFNQLPDINWAGFYLLKEGELVLGPFQGQPACIRIPLSKGVCGAAARQAEVQVVEDVHKFEGHIACDAASNSEIVIPIFSKGEVIAVLDIDSPVFSRFDGEDADGLAPVAKLLGD